jgi:hypothetical protein
MGDEQRPIARPRDFLDDDQERTLGALVFDDRSADAASPQEVAPMSSDVRS